MCTNGYGVLALNTWRIPDTPYWYWLFWVVVWWEDGHIVLPHFCLHDFRCNPVLDRLCGPNVGCGTVEQIIFQTCPYYSLSPTSLYTVILCHSWTWEFSRIVSCGLVKRVWSTVILTSNSNQFQVLKMCNRQFSQVSNLQFLRVVFSQLGYSLTQGR